LVDANVVRVLCRFDAIESDPKSSEVVERLWKRAGELLPPGRAGDFNQALMELGALVCQPEPRCGACPWNSLCRANAGGDPKSYPHFAPKPALTQQSDICAVIRRGDCVLLVRRPVGGLWGGLWELPRVTAEPGESVENAAVRACREVVGLAAEPGGILATHRHGVTTRRIVLTAVACRVEENCEPVSVGCDAVAWVGGKDRERYPLSSPQARVWEKVVPSMVADGLFGLE
jgi:A/G-specific adenine glycosylase